MSDQLPMFVQTTCEDSGSATSSLALECGVTAYDLPDGLTTGQAGPEAAPVQLSQQQVKAMGLETLVTSGRIGFGSSASVVLQSSLVSKLKQRLDMAGSTLFKLTWSQPLTPLGRRYLRQRASALRTSERGSISSVVSPQEGDAHRGGQAYRYLEKNHAVRLNDQAMLAAQLAAVPTPLSNKTTPQQRREALKAQHKNGNGFGLTLGMAANLANVATPSARDWKDTGENLSDSNLRKDGKSRLDVLPRQAGLHADSGEIASGGTGATGNGGQLNPEYSRWLMGLPPVFCDCAVTATALSRRSRKRS